MAPPPPGGSSSGSNIVKIKFCDSFFRDPSFADCRAIIENQKAQFESDCNVVHEKIFGNSQLRTLSILAPAKLTDYVQASSKAKNSTTESPDAVYNFTNMDKNTYIIILDVHQFRPHDITVKISSMEKNTIIIEGKHQEKKDSQNGLISRQFARKCVLPFNVKLEQLQCFISLDGVLQLKVPRQSTTNGYVIGKRELMTVDGRKLEESEVDLSKLDSKKRMNGIYAGLNHDHVNPYVKNGNWEPFVQTLPDFDMTPFWKSRSKNKDDGFGIQNDPENFKILVDMKQFLPDEINVRCNDRFVIIEAGHEAKEDPYGSIARQFSRTYEVPKGVKIERMKSNLASSTGTLQVQAPKEKPWAAIKHEENGRRIPIVLNGALSSDLQNMRIGQSSRTQENRVYVPPQQSIKKPPTQALTNGSGQVKSTREEQLPNGGHANSNVVNTVGDRAIIPFAVTSH